MSAYAKYLRSPHWRRLKRLYRESDLPQDCTCGATENLHLHHLTYERFGREKLEDLRPLCRGCHANVHGMLVKQMPFVPNDVGPGEIKPWDTARTRLAEPGKELKRRHAAAARRA